MKIQTLLVTSLLCFSGLVKASIDQAPPAFAHKDGKAVFVDFSRAGHELTYDVREKTVTIESVIDFESSEEGYPLFDLASDPYDVSLDGVETTAELISDPDAQTKYRVSGVKVSAGKHQLKLTHNISLNVVFTDSGVASAFWLSDLTDRRYMETYLPSNLEYDQHPRSLRVSVIGAGDAAHVIKANGKVTRLSPTSLEVEYPEHFTSSSPFFHLFPEANMPQNVQFTYPSIDGRMIPVDIYATVDINPFITLTKTLLAELEADYGPFPHDQVLIYGNSLEKGGMEYSGATATGLLSLGHELFHSYNARGVMPANGNAGWMDEAMARWRDNGYPLILNPGFETTKIGGHSIWRRFTDRQSYAEGSAFLARIAYKMNERGLSLKGFLKDWYQRHMFSTVTTPQFEAEVMEASGLNLSFDFNQYVYGRPALSAKKKGFSLRSVSPDEHHPHYTEDQLLKMTLP